MRQVEFKAYLSRSEFKRLGQNKPSVGLVSGVVAVALAWVFSAVGLGPSQLDFGTFQLGSSGRSSVQLTNRGLTEFHAASIAVEGADAKDFQVDAQPCGTVSAGESCVLWVDFRPGQSGEKHARLIVRTNDGSEFSSEFRGVAKGQDSVPVPLPAPTPVNPPAGRARVQSSGPAATSPKPPDIAQTSGGGLQPPPVTPPAPATGPGEPPVAPFHQPPPGVVPPDVPPTVSPSPVTSPPSPVSTPPPTPAPPLYAHASMTPGITQFSAASSDGEFFNSAAQTVTVISDGTADIRQLNLRMGLPGGSFNYTPTCPVYLARGQRCSVQVRFAPRDAQAHADSLTAYNGGVRLASVSLRGSSTVPQPPAGHSHLTFKPREVQFPISSSDGWVTVTENVAVISDGTADVQQLGLKIAPTGLPFNYSGNCSPHLAKQQTCILQVKFDQRSQRAYSATLTAYDGNTALADLPMRGGGSNAPQSGHPHVTMTPTALRFAGTMQYSLAYVPAGRTLEVRNDGPVDLRALSLRLSPAGAPFRYSNCRSGLARGQSCTVQVNFASKDAQQYVAKLIADEGGAQLASVQLYGMGSGGAPPKHPGGFATGVVDRAYPNGSAGQGNGAVGKAQPQGNGAAKSRAPAAGIPAQKETYRPLNQNRAATSVQQPPRVAPAPVATKSPPAKRAVQKKPPPPPPVR